jgi:SM-20-related protein
MRGTEQKQRLLSRLQLPCIQSYMESFSHIARRGHASFNYYSYAAGDCLLPHDDTDQGYKIGGATAPRRRLALVSYFHDEWRSAWGGELIIYAKRKAHVSGSPTLKARTVSSPGLARS